MSGTTVRIARTTRDKLRELAAREKKPMHIILDRAIEDYRRKTFLEDANRAYAVLRQDASAWQAEKDERKAWEATLGDGLEDT